MPSIYVHTIFADDVKERLDNKTQKIINTKDKYYKMFSQSFDNLYYYNFLSLKRGKDIRKLATYCHTHNTQKYFMNMISYIKNHNLYKNPEVMCYLYGSINHYISDSFLHPYINYRTGRYSKSRKEATKKYIGKHTNTEIRLDAYYYEKNTGNSFKKYKIYKELCNKLCFSDELKDTISYTFKETFDKDNLGNIFNKSYNQSRYIYKILMYDPHGIKLFFYKIMDRLTPSKSTKITSYCLHKDPIDESFFNRNKNYWCNPIDMDLISDDSWEDIYLKAVKYAVNLIKQTNKYINNKISKEEYLNVLKNNSYSTGVDCKDKRINKYFQY